MAPPPPCKADVVLVDARSAPDDMHARIPAGIAVDVVTDAEQEEDEEEEEPQPGEQCVDEDVTYFAELGGKMYNARRQVSFP